MDLTGLPGSDLVRAGLIDLAEGRVTRDALLVSMGATRLRELGIAVPPTPADADHELWRLLAQADPDTAHGRFNALVRQLVSFERALGASPRHR